MISAAGHAQRLIRLDLRLALSLQRGRFDMTKRQPIGVAATERRMGGASLRVVTFTSTTVLLVRSCGFFFLFLL